jgi:hypothetical protein
MPSAARAALLLLLCAGCGDRALDLTLSFDAACTLSVPQGGSILYEVLVTQPSGAQSALCGACLPVTMAIGNGAQLLAFLKSSAPSCNIPPSSSLRVRTYAWPSTMCPAATGAPTLCAESQAKPAPDGRSDGTLSLALSCPTSCAQTTCMPLSCLTQGLGCGNGSDGCGVPLSCGNCKPSESCVSTGTGAECQHK